jgi:tetratricopeptide (TPR) repeat protein
MNEPTQAKEVFEKAIASNPDYLPPYYAIARLHMRDKNEMDAIKQFNLILKKKPGQVVPHMILGTIYEMQKNLEMSEKHYREALKIKSDFVPAANNLAYMLAEGDKNIDEALEFARTAKAKASDDPNVADTLGWIYYKKGLYDSAVGEFRDSLKKLPDNALVNYHLGLALYRKGDTQKAKEVLEQALDLDGNFDGADNARSILSRL